MKYLIIQGNSLHKQFVECSICGREQVWMRAFKKKSSDENGYTALCSKCLDTLKKKKQIKV